MGEERHFKLAFVGSHGVGKTTLCFGLAARLKARDLSVEVVHEVARRCPLPINEETSLESQLWILHTQIAEEVAAAARYPLVICDRTVIDNYTYLLLAAGPVPVVDRLVEGWLETYDQLFLVPIVAPPRDDGLRAVDPRFQQEVETRLREELVRRAVPFHNLSQEPRERWVEVVESQVLEALRPPQLDLL